MRIISISTVALLAALLSSPTLAASVNLGGGSGSVLNLGGNSGGTNVSVNTGNGIGNGSNTTGAINTGLGGQNANANLNLFADDPDATATLGNGDNNTNGALDLFGDENDPTNLSGNGGTLGATPINVGTAGDGTIVNLFGGDSGDGASGTSGTGGDLFGSSFGSGSNMTLLASTDGSGQSCANPSAAQITAMTQRHQYDAQFAAGTRGINIVEVPLCKTAVRTVARIAANDANLSTLHSVVASRPGLRSALSQQGHKITDVIAADRQNGKLTLYVY